MTEYSRVKRERNRVDKQKVVQKKKLTEAPCEFNLKTVCREEHISLENEHFAGR